MAQLPLIGSTATVFSFPSWRIRTWAQRSAGRPLAKAAGQSTLQQTKRVRGSRAIATSSGSPKCTGNPVNSSTSGRGNDDEVTAPSELFVSAGGDGTVSEVVNWLPQGGCNAALGVLQLGTGSDVARTLGVPNNVGTAIEQIMAGKTRGIDLVRVTSDQVRYFINVSSGGFSGVVDEKLTPEMKRTWGPLAYLRSAAAAFSKLRGYATRVALDDAEALELDLYNVVVANGRYVAGGIPIAPEADLTDGLLDIVLIAERGPAELAILAAQILVGKHLASDGIIFRR